MQAFELTKPVVVCHSRHLSEILTAQPRLQPVARYNDLVILPVELDDPWIDLMISSPAQFRVRRYLDRFYLWLPNNDSRLSQEIIDEFFDLIAKEYESLIDVARNIENIKNLFEILEDVIRPFDESKLVDYGCGTGLSLRAEHPINVEIFGVDRCPTMREIAAARGLTVWSLGQLASQPTNSLDGAFSSYVFHLFPRLEGLRLLWSRIRIGGAFVANFHKNDGIERVNEFMRATHGTLIDVRSLPASEKHGTYLAYRKG